MYHTFQRPAMAMVFIASILPLGQVFGLDEPNSAGSRNVRRETRQPVHIEAYESTDVYAKASGFLKTVKLDIGDRVEKGQVLGELWIPEMDQELVQKTAQVEQAKAAVEQVKSQVIAAEARVAAAEAHHEEAKASIDQFEAEWSFRRSEYQRISDLVERGSIQEQVRDEKLKQMKSAEAAVSSAKARVKTAESQVLVERANQKEAEADLLFAQSQLEVSKANLERTRVLMDYAQVRAPFDGLIAKRWVDSGDFVASRESNSNEPLFTVVRVDKLRLVFDIPESQSTLIEVGQPTSMVVDALKGEKFHGRIVRTAGVLDRRTRTLRVEAELEEPNDKLRPGMFGMITVTFGSPEQITKRESQ